MLDFGAGSRHEVRLSDPRGALNQKGQLALDAGLEKPGSFFKVQVVLLVERYVLHRVAKEFSKALKGLAYTLKALTLQHQGEICGGSSERAALAHQPVSSRQSGDVCKPVPNRFRWNAGGRSGRQYV